MFSQVSVAHELSVPSAKKVRSIGSATPKGPCGRQEKIALGTSVVNSAVEEDANFVEGARLNEFVDIILEALDSLSAKVLIKYHQLLLHVVVRRDEITGEMALCTPNDTDFFEPPP